MYAKNKLATSLGGKVHVIYWIAWIARLDQQ
ncbi:UNVERIFIED_CONTAM: hypothetical protein ABIC26_000191 [Paenibacillus sp. PvR008]